MSARTEFAPLFESQLGYGHVSQCAHGASASGLVGGSIACFDFERDFYPYPSAHFKAIICCEIWETLAHDPIHMLEEIHRILRPGCHLVFTTRRLPAGRVAEVLEGCGLEITALEADGDRVYASARKIGPVRERYPAWLYPERA